VERFGTGTRPAAEYEKGPPTWDNGACDSGHGPKQEGTFSMGSSHTLDQLSDSCFDDTHAVANAGLLLPATLTERLGIEAAVAELVDLGDRLGHHRPGRKLLTLLHALVIGRARIHSCGSSRR
jgi:hypothetical protein